MPQWTNWLLGGFFASALALLIAVPLILNRETRSIITGSETYVDPADRLVEQISANLSHEVSGIVGFQATGDFKYADLYAQEQANLHQAQSDLHRIVPSLGDNARVRFLQLRNMTDHWHNIVSSRNLISDRLPSGEFRQRMFEADAVLQAAYQSAADFTEVTTEWRANSRDRVENLDRISVLLSALFALLAIAVMVAIANILRRLAASSQTLAMRAREEEALRQVAHELTGTVGLAEVLRRITENVAIAAEAQGVCIEIVESGKDAITCAASYGTGVPATGVKGPFRGSLAEEVLDSREPLIIPDISSERSRRSVFGELARTCSNCTALIVPLAAESRALGALFLLREAPHQFSEAEFPRIRILADMASLAIRRALTHEELQKIQSEEHFLSESSRVLGSSLDYGKTLRSVVHLAVPEIADWCALHLSEEGKRITVEVAHADPRKVAYVKQLQEKYPPRTDQDTGAYHVMQTGRSELFPDIEDGLLVKVAHNREHLDLLRKLQLKSAMIVPLTANDRTIGALTFVSEGDKYDAEDLAFAEDVARHAASAIENARLYTAAEEAVRARDEVLRVVSHDLRNPVSNISMTASLLLKGLVAEEKRGDMLRIIKRASERMDRLIEDLIAVARLRAGQPITIKPQPESASALVAEACEATRIDAEKRSIELTCETPTILPLVRADRNRIMQVLINLVDNALKFTPSGGAVSLECVVVGRDVRFSVRDTGRGIDEQSLSKIFDLFWQVKSTAHLGGGFGLAIAKSIVEQHGGKIWAESKPGRGSVFFFTLPQADVRAGNIDQERSA